MKEPIDLRDEYILIRKYPEKTTPHIRIPCGQVTAKYLLKHLSGHALKVYVALKCHEDKDTHLAWLSHNGIRAVTGISSGVAIKKAIGELEEVKLLRVFKGKRRNSEGEEVGCLRNIYVLLYLDYKPTYRRKR